MMNPIGTNRGTIPETQPKMSQYNFQQKEDERKERQKRIESLENKPAGVIDQLFATPVIDIAFNFSYTYPIKEENLRRNLLQAIISRAVEIGQESFVEEALKDMFAQEVIQKLNTEIIKRGYLRTFKAIDELEISKAMGNRAKIVKSNLKIIFLTKFICAILNDIDSLVAKGMSYQIDSYILDVKMHSQTPGLTAPEKAEVMKKRVIARNFFNMASSLSTMILGDLIPEFEEIMKSQGSDTSIPMKVKEFSDQIKALLTTKTTKIRGMALNAAIESVINHTLGAALLNDYKGQTRTHDDAATVQKLAELGELKKTIDSTTGILGENVINEVLDPSMKFIMNNVSGMTFYEKEKVDRILENPDQGHDSERYYLTLYKNYGMKTQRKKLLNTLIEKIQRNSHYEDGELSQKMDIIITRSVRGSVELNKANWIETAKRNLIDYYTIYPMDPPADDINYVIGMMAPNLVYGLQGGVTIPTFERSIVSYLKGISETVGEFYGMNYSKSIIEGVLKTITLEDKDLMKRLNEGKNKRFVRFLKSGAEVGVSSVRYIDSDDALINSLEEMVAQYGSDAKLLREVFRYGNSTSIYDERTEDERYEDYLVGNSIWEYEYVKKMKNAAEEYLKALKGTDENSDKRTENEETIKRAHKKYIAENVSILRSMALRMDSTLLKLQKNMAKYLDEDMIAKFNENLKQYVSEMQKSYMYHDIKDLYRYRMRNNTSLYELDPIFSESELNGALTTPAKTALHNLKVIIGAGCKKADKDNNENIKQFIILLDYYIRHEIFSIYINKKVLNDFYSVSLYNHLKKENALDEEHLEREIRKIRDEKGRPFQVMAKIATKMLKKLSEYYIRERRYYSQLERYSLDSFYYSSDSDLGKLIGNTLKCLEKAVANYEKVYKGEVKPEEEKDEKDEKAKKEEENDVDEEDEKDEKEEKEEKEQPKKEEIEEIKEMGYKNEIETTFMGANHVLTTPIRAKFKVNGSNITITLQGLPAQANNYKYRIVPIFEGVKTEKTQVVQNGSPVNFTFDKDLEGKEIGVHIYVWKDESKPISQLHPDEYVADAQINLIPKNVLELIAQKTMNDKFEDYSQMKTGDNQGNKPIDKAGVRVFRINGNLYVKLWKEMNDQMANKLSNICGGPNQTLPEGENRYAANKYGDKLGYIIPVKNNISSIIQEAMSVHLYNEKLESNSFYGYSEPKIEVVSLDKKEVENNESDKKTKQNKEEENKREKSDKVEIEEDEEDEKYENKKKKNKKKKNEDKEEKDKDKEEEEKDKKKEEKNWQKELLGQKDKKKKDFDEDNNDAETDIGDEDSEDSINSYYNDLLF